MRRPNDRQQAALEAALLPAASAIAAWERLRAQTNYLDETDIGTFRLLPLVYRNLRTAGLDESELGPLKGVYRQFWLRLRITLRAAESALRVLGEAGIEPVALKGLGLIGSGAYAEAALRPMHDLDFLIRPADFAGAVDALMAGGWKPLRGDKADYMRRANVFHALPLIGAAGVEIDMHRFMLEENCFKGADAPLLRRTRQGSLGDVNVTTASPEDQVINSCVHGVRWDPVPPIRWVPDAVVAVRAAGEAFDWDYLVGEATRRGVSIGMAAALAYAREFEPAIPAEVITRLANGKHGRLERLDFRFQQGGYSVPTQTGRYVTRYLRLASGRNIFRKAMDFPTYLEAMWELDSRRQVPKQAVLRVLSKGKKPQRQFRPPAIAE